MPIFTLNTNLPRSKFTEDFLLKTRKVVANALNRDEKHTFIVVNSDLITYFSTTNEPCCTSTLQLVDGISPTANKKYAKVLTDYFTSSLGIDSKAFNIIFEPIEASNIAYLGDTMEGRM